MSPDGADRAANALLTAASASVAIGLLGKGLGTLAVIIGTVAFMVNLSAYVWLHVNPGVPSRRALRGDPRQPQAVSERFHDNPEVTDAAQDLADAKQNLVAVCEQDPDRANTHLQARAKIEREKAGAAVTAIHEALRGPKVRNWSYTGLPAMLIGTAALWITVLVSLTTGAGSGEPEGSNPSPTSSETLSQAPDPTTSPKPKGVNP